MRYTLLLLAIATLYVQKAAAQINLVQNPSFESYWRCPNNADEIKFANYWSPIDTLSYAAVGDTFGNANCTPEFCHTCSSNVTVSVPINARFTHLPRTGSGMAQVMMYNSDTTSTYQRDYLQGTLRNNLVSGKQYCVTFYVLQELASVYAIDHIGAYLDDRTIDSTTNCGLPQTTHIPQVYTTTIINDTLNWVKIQGSFTATGIEKAITISNFFDIHHTDTFSANCSRSYMGSGILSWYLVDDVSVIPIDAVANAGPDGLTSPTGDSVWIGTHDGYLPCKWYKGGVIIDSNIGGFKVKPSVTTTYVMALDVCGTITYDTVKVSVAPLNAEMAQLLNGSIYPNPASTSITFEGLNGCNITMLNMVGQVVMDNYLCRSNKETIDIATLPKGVYVVQLMKDGERKCVRMVKE